MSPLVLSLVLCAALLHATWNIAAKRAGAHSGTVVFMLLTAIIGTVFWAPVAAWWTGDELWRLSAAQWGIVLATTVVHLGYYAALLTGYRQADLTVVYPVARGTGPLLTVVVAVVLLGERPGWAGALGVLGVCGGVFVLAGGPRLWQAAGQPAARARLRAGLRWGALTGLFIAAYSVIDGVAVKRMGISPVMLDWLSNALRVLLMLPWAAWAWHRDRAAVRREAVATWRHALAPAILGPMAYVMVLYALTMAPMSLVSPAREVSLLFAALIGGRLLGEGDRALRLAGAACIAGGVALLASA